MRVSFRRICTMEKGRSQRQRVSILGVSEMVCRMGMGSSGGRMGHFTEGRIFMGKDKVMVSFIMPRTQALVEDFGRKVFYRVKGSMFKRKEEVTNAFGEEAK